MAGRGHSRKATAGSRSGTCQDAGNVRSVAIVIIRKGEAGNGIVKTSNPWRGDGKIGMGGMDAGIEAGDAYILPEYSTIMGG